MIPFFPEIKKNFGFGCMRFPMNGEQVENRNISANLLRSKIYVCPVCGNVLHATGQAAICCCGVTLPPLEAEEADADHAVTVEAVEDVDGITLWTFNCKELPLLEARLEGFRKKYPDKKLLLGIYMFDFPSGTSLSDEQMEHQCEIGLRQLREGRLDGLIFEANSVMGVGLPSEKWLREWIDKVKYTKIPD